MDNRINWKRRPSEIRGYNRTLYGTSEDGDYLRVDYSLKEKRARLYVEVAEEGGAPYYAVIQDGRVGAERSVQSGRSGNFSDRFRKRAELFSTVPNREVLSLLEGHYGISARKKSTAGKEKSGSTLEETRRRYFSPEENPYIGTSEREPVRFFRGFGLLDLLDFLTGFMVSGLIFYVTGFNFMFAGIILAAYGLAIGLIDMFLRERDPVMIKVIMLLLAGGGLYIYGYYFF